MHALTLPALPIHASDLDAEQRLVAALLDTQTFRLHALLYAFTRPLLPDPARFDRLEHHIMWRVMTSGPVYARIALWERVGARHRVKAAPVIGNSTCSDPHRPKTHNHPSHPLSPHNTPFPGYNTFV